MANASLSGKDIIEAFRQQSGINSDSELAKHLGVTSAAISQWRGRKAVTARQIVGLVLKSQQSAAQRVESVGVLPIVEFFPLEKRLTARAGKYEIFDKNGGAKDPHPYLAGLREELEEHNGIYVFFDSSGRAIYAGKARKQTLWAEVNLVFNRNRGDLQMIRRVKHPSTRSIYKTSEEKSRQIVGVSVPLHELAAYVSAYAVKDGLISVVEAMLVRSFANDLLNKRMERFSASSNGSGKKQGRRKSRSAV